MVSKVLFYVRVQNSLFEGELTDTQFLRVETGMKKLIDESVDSVRIYFLRTSDVVKIKTIGVEKAQSGTVI
ncbi:MAG: CRISPR-associated endonuclease Cas2 [Candidatus Parvarchaeota archaeon]|nr:CRISPR-associated endonuclease Cas2 [Candidatus Jingweiarchaeum tengchongense]